MCPGIHTVARAAHRQSHEVKKTGAILAMAAVLALILFPDPEPLGTEAIA